MKCREMRRSIVLLLATVLCIRAVGLAPAEARVAGPFTCFGQAATIVGTPGDDTLDGTDGPDVMVGLGGNDTLNGMGGADVICGGLGDDKINFLVTPIGVDQESGGPGNDVLQSARGGVL